MSECDFVVAWVGECTEPAWSFDPPRCNEHAGENCHVCGEIATKECANTFGLVCGAPLCGSCDCQRCGNR